MPKKHDRYDEASAVKAKRGKVEVRGPDGVDVDLTPEAAQETSDRLLSESLKARGQRRLGDSPHQPRD